MTMPDGLASRLGVSRETSDRLARLVALLRKWNPRINLVGKATLDGVWTRHVEDSAQLFALAPESAESWVDLGSGGGFPGLVVAAQAAGSGRDLKVTLVESDSRKCAFLATAAREMDVSATVLNRRIEGLETEPYDVVSARALAPLDRLLELAEPLTGPHTVRLFPKGAGASSELTDARKHWHIACRSHPSATDPAAVILEIQEATRGSVLRT